MKATLLALALFCGSAVVIPMMAHGADAPTTAPSSDKPINTHCPVNRDEEIDPAVTTTYEGKTIAFCCKSCLPKFQKDPAKYMKDLK